MASLLTMIAPFVLIGLAFTASALLWARHKAQIERGPEVGSEELTRGGGR